MALQKLQFKPGIVRDTTNYSNEGGWFDCDKIRFRMGLPETIGGWGKFTTTTMLGTCRSLHAWTTLTGSNYVSAGTNLKFYIVEGNQPADITPIRLTTAAGDVTFSATDGSSTLTVTDVANGVYLDDFVTFFGAVSLGGTITATVLNQEYQVTNIVDANTFTINVGVTANSSDTGDGGAGAYAAYQINVGLDSVVLGSGWGAGVYSRGTWGSGTDTSLPGDQLRLWSQDNFGEDLIMNVRQGGIYYWDSSSGTGTRAVNIGSIGGATSVPTAANIVLVSERDRHVIAFGCTPEFGSGAQDPLTIRFSSQESVSDWETRADNTAGELRIGTGSDIIAAVQTKQQVIVFTDIAVYAMQYIGPPYTFGINEVSSNISIAGQNAAISTGDAVYWMGQGQFYSYNGAVTMLPCPVREYVFSNINGYQLAKVTAASNSKFSEIWWFYPSANSTNNDRYVVFNYSDNTWVYGELARTAWQDTTVSGYPIAAAQDGYLYFHEYGINDSSADIPAPISAFIESSVIDLGEGDQFMFASRLIPDITFRNSSSSPEATFTLKARNYPGGEPFGASNNAVIGTATVPIQIFTEQSFIRIRGRSISLRVASAKVDTAWRLGASRLDVRPDGKR
jgi:hypothetical protein